MADKKQNEQTEKTPKKHIDVRNIEVWRDKDKENNRKSTSGCRIY